MLVKSSLPLVPTVFDVRMRNSERNRQDALFSGWGISITGSRNVW